MQMTQDWYSTVAAAAADTGRAAETILLLLLGVAPVVAVAVVVEVEGSGKKTRMCWTSMRTMVLIDRCTSAVKEQKDLLTCVHWYWSRIYRGGD